MLKDLFVKKLPIESFNELVLSVKSDGLFTANRRRGRNNNIAITKKIYLDG